jgi:hypothetical protein
LTAPKAGENGPLTHILVGMYDYDIGLNMESFRVVADFPIDGVPDSDNLPERFTKLRDSRWELRLT